MDDIRLLHIDKSKTSQKLLEKALSPIADYCAVSSLEEARAAIAAQIFTFFLIDYELPDGDGLTLARELRATTRYQHTPIILYCASLDNELEYQAMRAGVNLSLRKLVNPLDLRDHIVRLVEVPSIKEVRRELLQLTCFSWVADGQYHEYSPDLNKHLQGDSLDEVRDRMRSALEIEIRAKKDPSQYPANVTVFKYVISLAAIAPPAK
ncbi:MAG: response regulator [Phycisphaeraceae bacterium]|nr:response regulator [Phycisphaeraceae bacterium]